MIYPDAALPVEPPGPLMTAEAVAALLGLTTPLAPPLDAQVDFAVSAVSGAIRRYTGRVITSASYVETWKRQPMVAGYQARQAPAIYRVTETPIHSIERVEWGGAERDVLLARSHSTLGSVWFENGAGPSMADEDVTIEYVGGYDPIPDDLRAVVLDLTRKQLIAMGVDLGSAGVEPAGGIKAVSVGALRVDYAVPSTNFSDMLRLRSTPLAEASIAEYASVLDWYRTVRTVAATGR